VQSGSAPFGDHRIVAGSAQPPAEAAQHLVAQKARLAAGIGHRRALMRRRRVVLGHRRTDPRDRFLAILKRHPAAGRNLGRYGPVHPVMVERRRR
jgi:hypothetical protein